MSSVRSRSPAPKIPFLNHRIEQLPRQLQHDTRQRSYNERTTISDVRPRHYVMRCGEGSTSPTGVSRRNEPRPTGLRESSHGKEPRDGCSLPIDQTRSRSSPDGRRPIPFGDFGQFVLVPSSGPPLGDRPRPDPAAGSRSGSIRLPEIGTASTQPGATPCSIAETATFGADTPLATSIGRLYGRGVVVRS
jgi:hypothetical protein